MLVEILAHKEIMGGATLSLERYELSGEAATALNRPQGSYELVLCHVYHGQGVLSTNPRTSHYLSEGDFRELYGAIQSSLHFDNVARRINPITDDLDVEKLREKGLRLLIRTLC